MNNTAQDFNFLKHDQPVDQIDLRIGEPRMSPFPYELFEDLMQKEEINYYYPSHGDLVLREMLLGKYYEKCLIGNIAITHGTIGALDFVFRANAGSEYEVLLPDPGFPPYAKLAEFSRIPVKKYSLNFQTHAETLINWDQLESLITSKRTLLLLNSPHNPTGKILTDRDITSFENLLTKYPQLSFVMDEVYRGLIYGSKSHHSFSDYIERGYVVGSFSKAYPLQGARVGWVLTCVDRMDKLSPYFLNTAGSMSSFGQELAKATLERKLTFKKGYYEAYNIACEILDSFGVSYIRPDGAFYIFIKYNQSDSLIAQELHDLGVDVMPGSVFGANGKNYIRVSFAQNFEVLEKAFTIIGEHWKQNHPSLLQ